MKRVQRLVRKMKLEYIPEINLTTKMNTGVIYLITNNINNKKYIGQAVSYSSSGRKWGSKRRWGSHCKNARNGNCDCRYLENAIRKYGESNFTVKDLLECTITELNQREIQYIEEYNTMAPFGYNLMSGGGNGRRHSLETRALMSQTRTGKHHTSITKKRIGDSNRGQTRTKQTKMKIGSSSKYRNMSSDNKTRLDESLAILGLKALPMYICLSVDRRYGRNVDNIVVRVPKKPSKKFGKKHMPLHEKIKLAIHYKTFVLNGHRSEGTSHPQ